MNISWKVKITLGALYSKAKQTLMDSAPIITTALGIMAYRFMNSNDNAKFNLTQAAAEGVVVGTLFSVVTTKLSTFFSSDDGPQQQTSHLRISRQTVKDLAIDAAPIVMITGALIATKYFTSNEKEKFNVFNAAFEGLGGSFLMSSLMNQPIAKFGMSFSKKMIPARFVSPALKQRIQLGEAYQAIKHMLPMSYIEAIDTTFRLWDSQSESGFADSYTDRNRIKLQGLLQLPYKGLEPILKERFHNELKSQFDALVKEYDAPFREQLKDYIMSIIEHVNHPEKADSAKQKLKPVFFQGEPGVGKTTFTENIAKILGIACVKIKLSATQSSEDLTGGSQYGDMTKVGIIIESLQKSQKSHQCDTAIILFDEIDKLFNATSDKQGQLSFIKSWLLDLLNSDVVEIESNVFSIKIPIKNLIIVLTGNRNFIKHFRDEGDKKAFNDRVKTYCFPPFKDTAKDSIGYAYYEKLTHSALKREDLSNLFQDTGLNNKIAIRDLIISYSSHPELVMAKIVQLNTHPGVRIMQDVIRDFVKHTQKKSYFYEWCPEYFNIQAAYQFYQNAELDSNEKEKQDLVMGSDSVNPHSHLGSDSDSDEDDGKPRVQMSKTFLPFKVIKDTPAPSSKPKSSVTVGMVKSEPENNLDADEDTTQIGYYFSN